MILKNGFDLMACCEAAGGIDIFDLADTLGVDTHDLNQNQTEAMDEVESVLTKGQFTKKEFFDVLKGLGDLPDGVQEVLEQSLDDGEDPSLPVFKVPKETIRGLLESPGFDLASLAEDCSIDVSDLDKDDILGAIMDNWRARTWTEKDLADMAEVYGNRDALNESIQDVIARAKKPGDVVRVLVEDVVKMARKEQKKGVDRFDAIGHAIDYIRDAGGELGLTQNEVSKAWRDVQEQA